MVSPPTRPALRARYERRRGEVIAVAARVFAEQGHHATSIDDLSAATGLAAGGLYHYFGSKDELLVRICDDLMDPLLEQAHVIVAAERDAEDRLRVLTRAWVEHVVAHRDHLLVFQQERHVIEQDPRWRAVRRKRKDFEQIVDDVLVHGERSGAFAFTDRGLALHSLLAMVNSLPQWFRPRGRLTPAEAADGFCDVLLGDAVRRGPRAPAA